METNRFFLQKVGVNTIEVHHKEGTQMTQNLKNEGHHAQVWKSLPWFIAMMILIKFNHHWNSTMQHISGAFLFTCICTQYNTTLSEPKLSGSHEGTQAGIEN